MQNLISEDRVIAEIMKIAVETLRVPEGKATADSSFVRDLGAESLDFLDIDYRLEQAFGIKMARHFFLEHVEEMFGEGAAIDEDGRLTKNALTLLRTRYGEENLPDLSNGLDMDQVPPLITIRSMADAVLQHPGHACPSAARRATPASGRPTTAPTSSVAPAARRLPSPTATISSAAGSGRCRTRPASSRADATEARSPCTLSDVHAGWWSPGGVW